MRKLFIALGMMAGFALAGTAPASAATVGTLAAKPAASVEKPVEQVHRRWRRHRHWGYRRWHRPRWYGYGYRRGYRWGKRHRGYRRGYYRRRHW
jgi:hypothetical protein